MVRNTDGLKRNAEVAARMPSSVRPRRSCGCYLKKRRSTSSVATRAKVSTAWLYGTKAVRDKIAKIRNTSPVSAGDTEETVSAITKRPLIEPSTSAIRLRV